jgi:hypothetical protein
MEVVRSGNNVVSGMGLKKRTYGHVGNGLSGAPFNRTHEYHLHRPPAPAAVIG